MLELGCGTGKNTEWLTAKAKLIIGLDFSDEMLIRAKDKIKSDKVRFQRADLQKTWEVDDSCFDLITCSLTLEHIKNLDFIFNQAHRKLRAGGRFFISEFHPARQYLGSKAKYPIANGFEELEVYTHPLSDYIKAAVNNAFTLAEINEWFDHQSENAVPRLITFVFAM